MKKCILALTLFSSLSTFAGHGPLYVEGRIVSFSIDEIVLLKSGLKSTVKKADLKIEDGYKLKAGKIVKFELKKSSETKVK